MRRSDLPVADLFLRGTYGRRGCRLRTRTLRRVAPSLVTAVGHLLSLLWLCGAPAWCGALGLLCDAADGWLARRLCAESEFGGLYDWLVDTTLLTLVLGQLGVAPLLVLVVPLQVLLRTNAIRVSGRAGLSAVLLLRQVLHG